MPVGYSRQFNAVRRSCAVPALSHPEWPPEVGCRRCEALRIDSRTSHGHDALRPTSNMYFRCIGSGVVAEAIEHTCRICGTTWTQHRSAASLFVS